MSSSGPADGGWLLCGKPPGELLELAPVPTALSTDDPTSRFDHGTWAVTQKMSAEPHHRRRRARDALPHVPRIRISTSRPLFSDVSAEWVPYAPDCAPSQIEIRTFAATIKAGNIVAEPAYAVSFSFVVLSGTQPPSGGGTPPSFEGLQGAFACSPIARPWPFELTWKAATDKVTPSSQIVYDIFLSHTHGGEDFSHPTWTTAPGVTGFETPPLSEPSYFVVRARDQAGNEDQNTVERIGEDPCE